MSILQLWPRTLKYDVLVTFQTKTPIFVISALLLAACGSSHAAKTSASTTTSAVTTTSTSVSTTTTSAPLGPAPAVASLNYVKTISSPSLVANITYPELGGMASNTIQSNINTAIKIAVRGYVTSFESQLGERSGLSPSGGSQSVQSQISGSFTTEFKDAKYVSFRFLITSYAAGAASPSTTVPTLTFDLATGQQMTLSSLFASQSYLTTLSNLSRSQLQSTLGSAANVNQIDGGTQPVPSNFADWNLTNKGLELSFSQGQVAAVASGVVKIVIPYANLSGIAKNSGPLVLR